MSTVNAPAPLPAEIECSLDAVLSYAPVPIPPAIEQRDPYKPDPELPQRIREWCKACGVRSVQAYLAEWVERFIRLAGEIETLGLWRAPGAVSERLSDRVAMLFRRRNMPAYMSHQTSALLHRAREIAGARRGVERVLAGEAVSVADLAAADAAMEQTDPWMSHQLFLIIHDEADALAEFKAVLRKGVEDLVSEPVQDTPGAEPGRHVDKQEVSPERLSVDEASQTATLDGRRYHVENPRAFRFFAEVAKRKGVVVSGRVLKKEPMLHGGRFDKLRTKLPRKLDRLINGTPGAGYNLVLPARTRT